MTDNLELEKKPLASSLRIQYVVLGLIFLKYISDAFDELYEQLKAL